jgi:hypothetical protein
MYRAWRTVGFLAHEKTFRRQRARLTARTPAGTGGEVGLIESYRDAVVDGAALVELDGVVAGVEVRL